MAVRGAQHESDAICAEYERQWALANFADPLTEVAIRRLTATSLPKLQRVMEAGDELRKEDPERQLEAIERSLLAALEARKGDVARARRSTARCWANSNPCRTVTMPDADRVSRTLGAVASASMAARYSRRRTATGRRS